MSVVADMFLKTMVQRSHPSFRVGLDIGQLGVDGLLRSFGDQGSSSNVIRDTVNGRESVKDTSQDGGGRELRVH